ncbi:glycosyl hydrolase [Paenibacillus hamazuiensis]|uniref:glycosyl hydrolase n=1 Tax=Paenibacillus hamazuiensis TaxID=2936508 RepID=UPI00200E57F7|nr:glycosyl hydrolase [Paenibacillus hamazuiensis]
MDWIQFQQPGPAFRIHPFWFWNGEMSDDQIERQIAEMADKGVGGFFVCARQGLTLPYLSQAWFAKVRTAVESAKKHGMHVWLYDEYPYPSGIAGGEVTLEHPEAKHYTLVHEARRVSGGQTVTLELPWARILYAKAVPLSKDSGEKQWERAVDVRAEIGNYQAEPVFQKAGLTAYNRKRFFTYRTIYKLIWDVPPGEWEIVVFLEKELDDFKYYGTFVDPCNRKAMETFIRKTHDKYAEHLSDYFGTTIKGMFTDEIGLLGRIPWSPQLPDYFKRRSGYDLRENLHALYYADHPEGAKVRYDYYQAVHLLLRDTYHKQVHDWCERHGLQYVAEVPAVRMTTQLYSHVPGGDSAHEKLGRSLDWILEKYAGYLRANPKMVSSLARQLGRERNLIECFHSVGWSMTLQDAKWMIDRMAALGTNFYNFHAFFYTLGGMTKHDAPPSQFLQNPYWPHFRKLGDYTGRISYIMSAGKADIRIALLDPTTTFWTHLGNPFHSFHYGGASAEEKERLARLQRDWEATGVHLLKNRLDYDHLDPELLAGADVSQGSIRLGAAEYDVLVIPPVTNLEAAAWEKIRAFAEQGGRVIVLGLLPHEAIEPGSPQEVEASAFFGADAAHRDAYWGETAGCLCADRTAAGAVEEKVRNHGGQKEFRSAVIDTHAAGEAAGMIGESEPSRRGEAAEAEAAAAAEAAWTRGELQAYFIPCRGSAGYGHVLDALLQLLGELAPAAVHLDVQGGRQSVLMQTRRLAEDHYAAFISHQEDGMLAAELQVDATRLCGNGGCGLRFARLDLETGKSVPLAAVNEGGVWKLPLSFEPYESHLIGWSAEECRAEASSAVFPDTAEEKAVWDIPKDGKWHVQAQSDNAIRFDTFRLSLDAEEAGAEGPGHPVKVKTLIDQCEDLAKQRRFPLAFSQTFGTPMKLSLAYPLICTYRTEFMIEEVPAFCRLFMDEAAISGTWTLTLNGHPLTREHFARHEVYDYTNIACDVTRLLRTGMNELAVRLQAEHDWDGVTDALYLAGPFGVEFGRQGLPIMKQPPLSVQELPQAVCPGYPYYAGTLVYGRIVSLDELPAAEQFELRIGGWNVHDTVEVKVNGQSLGVRPWSPYRWQGAASLLKHGENLVEVLVAGSLAGLLEGTYFDDAGHVLRPVHERHAGPPAAGSFL